MNYSNKIKSIIRNKKLENNIKIWGEIDEKLYNDLHKESDFYVNGVKIDTVEGGLSSWATPGGNDLYIGYTDNASMYGMIDEVRIYNIPLPSSQIKQDYIAGLNSMLANGNMSKEEYNERIENLSKK